MADVVPWGSMVAIAGSGVRWLVVDFTATGMLVLARGQKIIEAFGRPPRGQTGATICDKEAVAHPTAVVVLRAGWTWRPPA